jgi:hypothetical protein
MQVGRSWAASQTPKALDKRRLSFTHFFANNKKLSLIGSSALLVGLSAAVIGFGNQPTGASSGTAKGVSVEVNSNSDQTPPTSSDPVASGQSSSSSTQTSVNQTSSGGTTHTQVQVNGQNIPVPENGSVEQTVSGNGNQSDVHVMINNQSSGSSSSSNSTQIISSSSSSVEGGTTAQ